MAQSLQETWLPDAESTRMRRRWAEFPDIAQGSEYRPALSKRPIGDLSLALVLQYLW